MRTWSLTDLTALSTSPFACDSPPGEFCGIVGSCLTFDNAVDEVKDCRLLVGAEDDFLVPQPGNVPNNILDCTLKSPTFYSTSSAKTVLVSRSLMTRMVMVSSLSGSRRKA